MPAGSGIGGAMAEKHFDIVFDGKLTAGAKPPEVLRRLCEVLGQDEAQVRQLFKAGSGAVIRAEQDKRKAYALRDQLEEGGVLCTVKEIEPLAVVSPVLSDMQPMTPSPRKPSQHPQDMKPAWQVPVMPQKGPGIVLQVFKIVFLVAIVFGGWWVYQTWFAPPTPAFTAYAGFAEDMARGNYQKAADGSLGGAKGYAESFVQLTRPTTMKVYGKEFSMSPPSVASIAGDIAWIKRKKKSERKKSPSVVELQVEQTVCRIPPGVTSALCKWPVTFQHDVELQLTDDTWKVAEFKEVRLTPQDK